MLEALQGKAVTYVGAGGFHTAAIIVDGNMMKWGGSYFG